MLIQYRVRIPPSPFKFALPELGGCAAMRLGPRLRVAIAAAAPCPVTADCGKARTAVIPVGRGGMAMKTLPNTESRPPRRADTVRTARL